MAPYFWGGSHSHTRRTVMLRREGTCWPARRSFRTEQGEGKGTRKEEGQVKVQTHSCRAPGPDLRGESPVTLPAPGPHRMQAFCKWLISFKVCWAPQSSLSRIWLSWVSKSLGQMCSEGWPRGSRSWRKMRWAEWAGSPRPGSFSPAGPPSAHSRAECWPSSAC